MLYISPFAQSPMPTTETAERTLSTVPDSEQPFRWNDQALGTDDWNWGITSFTPETEKDPVFVPIRTDEPWETIPLLAASFTPRMIIGIFPTLLQLERRYMAVIKTLGYPACLFPPQNAAVAAAVIDQLHTEAVVGTQQALEQFAMHVSKKAPMRYYQMILAPHEPVRFTPKESVVAKEIHLIPGIVGLFQCEELAQQHSSLYHPSDRFIWEIDDSCLRVTDPAPRPRFARTLFLNTIKETWSTCSCKRTLYIEP